MSELIEQIGTEIWGLDYFHNEEDDSLIKRIIALCQPQWIPVSELPNAAGWYIVMDKDCCLDESWPAEYVPPQPHSKGYFEFIGANDCRKPDDSVAYYLNMPLPEPPNE